MTYEPTAVAEPTDRIGPILAAVGGAAAALGTFLAWAKVSIDLSSLGGGSQSQNVSGIDAGARGYAVLTAGIVALVCGLIYLFARTAMLRRVLGILALVGGLVALGLGIWTIVEIQTEVQDLIQEGLGEAGPEAAQFFEAFDLKVSTGLGLYLATVGGALALIGGIIATARAARGPDGMYPATAAMSPAAPGTMPSPPPGGMDTTPPPPPPGGPEPPPAP